MQTPHPQMLPSATVYADGSAKGNGSKNARGGWGFRVEFSDGRVEENFGGETPTTNNRMELLAVINALGSLKGRHQVVVWTDSQYVVKGMTEWLAGWKRRGWKSSTGEAVKNIELWTALDAAAAGQAVTWRWVRGHNGHPGNERADELANMGVSAR
jgi:ribonuclease HI